MCTHVCPLVRRLARATLVTLLALPTASLAQPQTPEGGNETPAQPLLEEIARLKQQQAQLKQRLDQLEQQNQQQQRKLLTIEAQTEATAADAAPVPDRRELHSGLQARQALNPEISVIGDLFGQVIVGEREYASAEDRSQFIFRVLGIHIESNLDPYALVKAAVEVHADGVELGEAYLTWTGLLPGVSLTAGKFRQELGVLNRWHVHALDQVEYPLALREILGPEGLNQVGLSVEWLMPRLWAHANRLVLQLTNGQNDRLFAGRFASIPSVLLRLKSYYDLSLATSFELGMSGMVGWNNVRGAPDEATGKLADEPWRTTWLFGADWTLLWEPPQRAGYRNLLLRGELYGVRKLLCGEDLLALGLYQYVQTRLSQRWELGVRFDWTMPFAVDNAGQHIFGAQPYLTWCQSHWVRVRLLYGWTGGDTLLADDHRVLLQLTFAAGPHKHEHH